MPISNIWVFAEAIDGKVEDDHPRAAGQGPHARRRGHRRVRRRRRRRRRGARRPRRHQGARHRRPRRADAGRRRRLGHRRSRAQAPDLFLLGTTYEGRDVAARLSVKLDKPVLTNNIDLDVDGDAVTATTPIFGGTQLVRTKFTGAGPYLVLVRPKSFAAEPSGGGAAAVEALAVRRPRCRRRGQDQAAPRRGAHRSEARRGRRRRVRRPWPRRGRQVRDGRAAGQAAQGCAGRVPGHRRRRLGALLVPGRPDRQGRQADASTSPPASPAPPSTWSA